ncbi:hypothetical protein NDU88_003842 [Pleurodeles waltl]|uniref:Uncharacterized protein n=1 Tax=Pleurodeles waltl TaxID=8319 RepID=A0AAV7PEA2_PLEWA|nr:hypothetical protein NDU88_003842 [Pleurodeles waltl]
MTRPDRRVTQVRRRRLWSRRDLSRGSWCAAGEEVSQPATITSRRGEGEPEASLRAAPTRARSGGWAPGDQAKLSLGALICSELEAQCRALVAESAPGK